MVLVSHFPSAVDGRAAWRIASVVVFSFDGLVLGLTYGVNAFSLLHVISGADVMYGQVQPCLCLFREGVQWC